MKRVSTALVLSMFPLLGQAETGSLLVDGLKRTYRLHVPATYRRDTPAGLLFAFHGGSGTGAQMERFVDFSRATDPEGFIVAYPDAVERSWNDGRAVETIRSQREGIDDVKFISALIDAVGLQYNIDPKRIYAAGISNGAMFSHFLAARASKRIAAIAAVAGGVPLGLAKTFHPESPVSVLIIQGTADPLVPFQGGPVARDRGSIIPTEEAVEKWATHDGCPKTPSVRDEPDVDPRDGTRVRQTSFGPCKDGTEVVLYTIQNGGHTWPGASQYLPVFLIGRTSRDMDATAVIVRFFAGHPKR